MPYRTRPNQTKPYHIIPYHSIIYYTMRYDTLPYRAMIFRAGCAQNGEVCLTTGAPQHSPCWITEAHVVKGVDRNVSYVRSARLLLTWPIVRLPYIARIGGQSACDQHARVERAQPVPRRKRRDERRGRAGSHNFSSARCLSARAAASDTAHAEETRDALPSKARCGGAKLEMRMRARRPRRRGYVLDANFEICHITPIGLCGVHDASNWKAVRPSHHQVKWPMGSGEGA